MKAHILKLALPLLAMSSPNFTSFQILHFTPISDPLLPNLFSLSQNKSLISWRPASLWQHRKWKKGKNCWFFLPHFWQSLICPSLRHTVVGVPYPSLAVKRIFGPAGEVAAAEISVFGNRSWNQIKWDISQKEREKERERGRGREGESEG